MLHQLVVLPVTFSALGRGLARSGTQFIQVVPVPRQVQLSTQPPPPICFPGFSLPFYFSSIIDIVAVIIIINFTTVFMLPSLLICTVALLP